MNESPTNLTHEIILHESWRPSTGKRKPCPLNSNYIPGTVLGMAGISFDRVTCEMGLLSCFSNWIYFLFLALILLGSGNSNLIYLRFMPLSWELCLHFQDGHVWLRRQFWYCPPSMLASDEASLYLPSPCH